VRTCEACARVVAELEDERDSRLTRVPKEAFLEAVAARRDRPVRLDERRAARVGLAFVALVAAAAVLLFFFRRPPRVETEGVALKGNGVSVHRRRGDEVKALATGDTIRAGDALRIVVTQSRASRVAAWFVDARGQVDRAFEAGAIELPAGESSLPGSVVIDAPCVDLSLVVVFGAASLEGTERTLKENVARGPRGEDLGWAPEGALTRRLRCE
jgi:hypothetical protein